MNKQQAVEMARCIASRAIENARYDMPKTMPSIPPKERAMIKAELQKIADSLRYGLLTV